MTMSTLKIALAVALLGSAVPASANSIVPPGPVAGIAKSSIGASPAGEWNRLSRSDGKNIEVWTRDGDSLNKITFFGGIADGQPLYKERDKKNMPLPKVQANMLVADIPVLFETTYRSQYRVNKMSIDSQEMVQVNGKPAIRFTYTFVKSDDEVLRSGEAVAALVKGKLFLVSYEAPSIWFFGKDLEGFHQVVQTLKF